MGINKNPQFGGFFYAYVVLQVFYKKISHKGDIFHLSGGPGRTVNPHVRYHSMGPIRYVRFKRRIRLFSPTDAPNRRFSSDTGKNKNPQTGILISGGPGRTRTDTPCRT